MTTRDKAIELLVRRGHAYKQKSCWSVVVTVFSKSLMELDLIRRHFGGYTYPHMVGYYWHSGNRAEQLTILEAVRPFLTEGHDLQALIALGDHLRETFPDDWETPCGEVS
jgi:hypothetical protein